MTNQIDENQFQLVAELLQRQDEALVELEKLCQRVEQAIEENIGSRPSEDSQASAPAADNIDEVTKAA